MQCPCALVGAAFVVQLFGLLCKCLLLRIILLTHHYRLYGCLSDPPRAPCPSLHKRIHTAADTYNLGGSATLYLAIDASSLNSIPGLSTNNQAYTTAINPTTGQPYTTTNTNNWANYVRVSPADAAPPTTPPGITITGSATYTYNIIVSKMYTCMDQRTVSCRWCRP